MKFFVFCRGSVVFKRFGDFLPLKELRNKKAEGYIPVCIITVCVCTALALTLSFISATAAVSSSKEKVRTALDGFVTRKSIEIYNGVKSYSEFADSLDAEGFESILSEYTENANYEITDLTIEFRETDRLNYTVKYVLKAPISLGNIRIVYTNVPVRITGVFNYKF